MSLHTTQGLVLGYIPYKENSVIVKIFTRKFGIQTYVENSVRTAKGFRKMAHFQPLTILDLVVYHHEKREIHRISEHKLAYIQTEIPFNTTKGTIALFMCEVLTKCLKEESEQPQLFAFLIDQIKGLDQSKENLQLFHIQYLIDLSTYLGFFIENGASLIEELRLNHVNLPDTEQIEQNLDAILTQTVATMPKKDRYALLEALIYHYSIHVPNFGTLKSIEVLKEVFS